MRGSAVVRPGPSSADSRCRSCFHRSPAPAPASRSGPLRQIRGIATPRRPRASPVAAEVTGVTGDPRVPVSLARRRSRRRRGREAAAFSARRVRRRPAEADGNRTRLTEILGHVGFEDRGEHQLPERLPAGRRAPVWHARTGTARRRAYPEPMTETAQTEHVAGSGYRLTQYAHGGGCACKIPPGELEQMVAGLARPARPSVPLNGELLVGLGDGDDAAVVVTASGTLVATADFFTPVVDDAYDWGRIAAANALSDVYAMGGWPVVAVNLLGWPRDVLPFELAAETLRGGLDVCAEAGCHLAGGHSVDDPEPKYGLAVTGIADPDRLMRNDAAGPGLPISLTKPLGVGVLNSRHK